MDDDPGGARCAHFTEGDFLLSRHRCSNLQVLWALYHRSVRMYSLRSETNRRSGSAAKVRDASIRAGLFGGRSATTTQAMTPKAKGAPLTAFYRPKRVDDWLISSESFA